MKHSMDKSKFSNHFALTLGRYLFCYRRSGLFNVDVNYSYIYLINYSCSLKCIERDIVKYSYSGSS